MTLISEELTEKLARWWNTLNVWEWPDDLNGKPNEWDSIIGYDREHKKIDQYSITMPIMRVIDEVIGRKECLRWHHINNLNRTDEEFERWWREAYIK